MTWTGNEAATEMRADRRRGGRGRRAYDRIAVEVAHDEAVVQLGEEAPPIADIASHCRVHALTEPPCRCDACKAYRHQVREFLRGTTWAPVEVRS